MAEIAPPKKILFVMLVNPKLGKSETERDITELWNLTQTMGGAEVMDVIVQKGPEHPAKFIGPGKAEEIAGYLRTNPVDIVVMSGQLNPSQKFNLLKLFWDILPTIVVWDRVDLILAIFSKHAHTTEASLQIELARMRHMGPAIFGMGMILSRQGGGVGTRGIGETNTERMRRHWKREIKRVTDELAKITQIRQRQIDNRRNLGLSTISIVGYTNAGKTSLFNLLTHKTNLVENVLFATLDSTVGEIYIPELGKKVIISDTIGFIQNLPPDLIDAFKSTLLESIHADIILHVIDTSDPAMREKIRVVEEILDHLHIPDEKIIFVYNKIDEAKDINRKRLISDTQPYPYVFISAKTGEGIDALMNAIMEKQTDTK